MENKTYTHIPVMLSDVIENIPSDKDNPTYIDCTFGGGSYSKALLNVKNANVFAIDQDQEAKTTALALQNANPRFHFFAQNFSQIKNIANKHCLQGNVDAVIFDLGTSAMQIDNPDRGFSFTHDGPLDMRMNTQSSLTADKLINKASEKQLIEIIKYYGEEKRATLIAKAITSTRQKKPIRTTRELSDLIKTITGEGGFIKVAAKVFQALRIYVNDEIQSLEKALNDAASILAPGGRIIVVSFHGLECRVVKAVFRSITTQNKSPESFSIITKKALIPSDEELKKNPRARSAKLRILEKSNLNQHASK